jgi:glutaredoxin 3
MFYKMKTFILSIILLIALGTDSYGQITESGLNDNLISQEDLKKIIVYGSDTCHYCIDTKAYLKEKNLDFIYYDIDVNLLRQREMLIKLQKSGVSVDNLTLPVVDLQGRLIMNSSNFEGFLKKLTASKN